MKLTPFKMGLLVFAGIFSLGFLAFLKLNMMFWPYTVTTLEIDKDFKIQISAEPFLDPGGSALYFKLWRQNKLVYGRCCFDYTFKSTDELNFDVLRLEGNSMVAVIDKSKPF